MNTFRLQINTLHLYSSRIKNVFCLYSKCHVFLYSKRICDPVYSIAFKKIYSYFGGQHYTKIHAGGADFFYVNIADVNLV